MVTLMSNGPQPFTVWHGLLLAESAALMIALLMPITPSKTGSGRGIAHYLIPEPSYFEQVFVFFLLNNLLILALGAVIWLWVKFT